MCYLEQECNWYGTLKDMVMEMKRQADAIFKVVVVIHIVGR